MSQQPLLPGQTSRGIIEQNMHECSREGAIYSRVATRDTESEQ